MKKKSKVKPYLKRNKEWKFKRIEVSIRPYGSLYWTVTDCGCLMISFYKLEVTIISKKCYNAYRKIGNK